MDIVLNHPARAVSATGVSHVAGQPENTAYMTVFFDNNLIAHIHANWLAPVKVRRTLIGGSQKMSVYDDLEPSEKVRLYDKGVDFNNNPESIYQMLVSYRTGDAWIPKRDSTEALAREARHFVDCVLGKAQPLSSGAVGLGIVRILERATASIARRGQPVDLA